MGIADSHLKAKRKPLMTDEEIAKKEMQDFLRTRVIEMLEPMHIDELRISGHVDGEMTVIVLGHRKERNY